MRVRLLGPVDVITDGVSQPVSGLRRKAVLAVLALHPGEVVSSGRLADVLWGDAPPATAQNTLQRHVSHLRDVLGNRAAIVGRPPGYLLDPAQVETDVALAERLIRSGSRAASRAAGVARVEQMREALALWRGPALSDVDGLPWLEEQAARLERLRLDGNQALVQARLALGEHAAVLPELEVLTREQPFDEGLHAQLVLALYRCGRQADALAACRRLRKKLQDELGIEPGRDLRDLTEAILRQDRSLDLVLGGDVSIGGVQPAASLAPPLDPAAPLAPQAGFAAEAADVDTLVLSYATAAARRAARLGEHREAAAQYQRALRFADQADQMVVAALHEGLAKEAALLDEWADAAQAQERALAAWRELGDPQREGGALWRLSRIRWNQHRGREALGAAAAAVRVLEALGPGPELAQAYATYAGQRMMSDEHDEAISLAARAQELAAHLGATDVYSDALNTQAVSLGARGRPWAAQLRRALDIALAGGHHVQAARAYCNLAEGHVVRREFATAEPVLTEGIAYCDSRDITAYGRCLRGEQSSLLEHAGRWDEAVALCADLLPQVEHSPVNRLSALRRLAVIRARRGEPGVWDYLDEAMDIAVGAGVSRLVVSARLARAEAYWLDGAADDARHEAELGYAACGEGDAWERGAVAAWLARTRSAYRVRGAVAMPYRLLLAGNAAASAACWASLGSPYDAALAAYDAGDAASLREARRIADSLGAAALTRLAGQPPRYARAGQAAAGRAAASA